MEEIAVIGTGIAGMGAAYFLKDKYKITFFEKNNYVGGHTNTLTIDEEGKPIFIDSAFMVYNERTYPNLIRLFKELDVPTKATSMSFSVQHTPSGLEYCGTGLDGLFAQRRNVFNVKFIQMLLSINRFREEAVEVLDNPRYLNYTVDQYALEKNYNRDFIEKFLLPMSSAVWSAPVDKMLQFPIVTLVRFFTNHCFLGLEGHLSWRTVIGGSRQYRDKLMSHFRQNVFINTEIVSVSQQSQGVLVIDLQGQRKIFDKVILASHADESLKLLKQPTDLQRKLLGAFAYESNKTTLHTDASIMPKTRKAWSSWNYRIDQEIDGSLKTTTIYDMNSLQGVSTRRNYFISINGKAMIDPKKIIKELEYAHPLYTVEGIKAQGDLPRLNEEGPIYFCGAYFKYGFHEDALTAGLNVARKILNEDIWS